MHITAHNESDTGDLAIKIAGLLQSGDVVFLQGDLGAGKTFFARALIRALADHSDLDVPSPTFTLLQTYETRSGPVWHFDLYRIKNVEEIYELGWEEALTDGILLIEWPERLDFLAPSDRLDVVFGLSEKNPTQRDITLHPYGAWKERLSKERLSDED